MKYNQARPECQPPNLDVSVERDRRTDRQRLKPNSVTMAAEFVGDNISHNVNLDRRRDALTTAIRDLREDWEKLNQDIRERDDLRNRSYQGRAILLNRMRRLECPGA